MYPNPPSGRMCPSLAVVTPSENIRSRLAQTKQDRASRIAESAIRTANLPAGSLREVTVITALGVSPKEREIGNEARSGGAPGQQSNPPHRSLRGKRARGWAGRGDAIGKYRAMKNGRFSRCEKIEREGRHGGCGARAPAWVVAPGFVGCG